MTCSCRSSAELCELCRDGLFAQLRGTAANRGERWSNELAAKRRAPWIPWPVDSRMVRKVALELVADLMRDEQLRGMLADELERWAAKRWDNG